MSKRFMSRSKKPPIILEKILRLGMLGVLYTDSDTSVQRVPGGYIWRTWIIGNEEVKSISSVFVPLHEVLQDPDRTGHQK